MAIDIDVERRFGASVIGAQFTAEAGLTALFGPSGVGKTSLLKAALGPVLEAYPGVPLLAD